MADKITLLAQKILMFDRPFSYLNIKFKEPYNIIGERKGKDDNNEEQAMAF